MSRECRTCKGKGKVICPRCQGDRKIRKETCYYCQGDGKKDCPACQGKGYVEE